MKEKKSKHIPVNRLPTGIREGIYIAKTSFNGLPNAKEVERAHRDNGHLFILQEQGTTRIEIDFQEHSIAPSSIMYIHPDQIHRLIAFENATTSNWIITSENLHPANLQLLAGLTPVSPLALDVVTCRLIAETAALCITFYSRRQEKLYNSILQESCNTLVSLFISQYLAQSKTTNHAVRFGVITKLFKSALEDYFKTVKSPAAYAKQLNIATPYLNECVKTITGQPVSFHIQQRVILEAKRLLYHSDKSIKEIAGELGYADYSYFIRLFVKSAGMTPLSFRNKNLE